MSKDIFLNIDTIVLHGLHHIDRQALAEALEKALSEELSVNQVMCDVNLSRVKTNISLPSNFAAKHLGRNLAQSLIGVISGNSESSSSGLQPNQRGDRDT